MLSRAVDRPRRRGRNRADGRPRSCRDTDDHAIVTAIDTALFSCELRTGDVVAAGHQANRLRSGQANGSGCRCPIRCSGAQDRHHSSLLCSAELMAVHAAVDSSDLRAAEPTVISADERAVKHAIVSAYCSVDLISVEPTVFAVESTIKHAVVTIICSAGLRALFAAADSTESGSVFAAVEEQAVVTAVDTALCSGELKAVAAAGH
mmetsp:Transcript_30459/g.64299  ORF Transcript_30459/g.64299 Transcript_30459/m.64299 type:complete len:206 (+) Transcript_30459:2700-3317(+)